MDQTEFKTLAHYFKNVLIKLEGSLDYCPLCGLMYYHTDECVVGQALKIKIPVVPYKAPKIFKCKQCGKKIKVTESRVHICFCSVECYMESLKLDETQIFRLAKLEMNKKQAAQALGIPYSTFMRKLKTQGLTKLFPRYPHKFK